MLNYIMDATTLMTIINFIEENGSRRSNITINSHLDEIKSQLKWIIENRTEDLEYNQGYDDDQLEDDLILQNAQNYIEEIDIALANRQIMSLSRNSITPRDTTSVEIIPDRAKGKRRRTCRRKRGRTCHRKRGRTCHRKRGRTCHKK
jgi:hypothetical protein